MSTETKTERVTLAEILASGYLTGYQPGEPPTAHPENIAIDKDVCRTETCEHCGHHGLRYRAYHNESSYLAFALCPSCFHASEF